MLELCFAILLPAIASALLFYENASGGGTDIIAMVIRKYSTMNVSTALLWTDLVVVVCAFLVFDTVTGLCSILGLLAKSLVIDKFIERMKLNKYFTIVSTNPDPICIISHMTYTTVQPPTMRKELIPTRIASSFLR